MLQVGTILFYVSGYADTLFLATVGFYRLTPVPDPIVFDETRLNSGGHYNNTNGIYTVPTDVIYEFNVNIRSQPDHDFGCYLAKDGVDVAHVRNSDGSGPGYMSTLLVIPVHATAGQQLWVRPMDLSYINGRTDDDGELTSWFSGRLIIAD